MRSGPPRYRFGPRSTRGLVAGWRSGQILVLGLGALVALGAVHSLGGIGGAGVALLAVTASVAAAVWPVAGRPIESWAPTVVRHLRRQLLATPRTTKTRGGVEGDRRQGVRCLSEEEAGGHRLGVVEDVERDTLSAGLRAGGTGFALLDEDAKAAAIAAWAEVLAAMARAGSVLQSLQWIARSRPASDRASCPSGSTSPAECYRDFLSWSRPRLWEREALVVLTTTRHVGAGRRRRSSAVAVAELEGLVTDCAARLRQAGLVVDPPLDRAALEEWLAPTVEMPAGAGAVGVEEKWHALRTAGDWHATYWVAEWPRSEVGPGVLVPLLVGATGRRTVSITMTPLAPLAAVRRAERERTAGASDAELRRRHGFSQTARARAEQELRLQREAELAEGHAAYLFTGFVSVTASDEVSLTRACAEAEQAAALCQLELRRLYGQQLDAWLCTLPTGRGCA